MSDITTSSLTKISPNRMKAAILQHARSLNPAFFWGHPGVAKSAVIAQVTKALGYHLEDIRLSQMSSIDLRGMPTKGGTDSEPQVIWAMPDFLRRAKHEWEVNKRPTVFFFDELNSAGTEVMKAAYQFIFDRRIGPFKLNPKDVVLAAGNFMSDGSNVSEMPIALLNRFKHYHTVVNADDWCSWAIKANIHPWIIAYIDANPLSLHYFQKKNAVQLLQSSAEKAFYTPRTWEFLSNDLHAILGTEYATYEQVQVEDENFDIEPFGEEDLKLIAASAVGSAMAEEFMSFIRLGKDVPKAKDVLEGKAENNERLRGNLSGCYMLSNSACYILKKEKDEYNAATNKETKDQLKAISDSHVKNFINFAKVNFNEDLFTLATVEKMTRQLKIIAPMSSPEAKMVLDAFNKITKIDKFIEES